MDMSDDKKSDERDQISKNYEEKSDWRYRSLENGKIEFAEKSRDYWKIIWRKKTDGYEWWQGIWLKDIR